MSKNSTVIPALFKVLYLMRGKGNAVPPEMEAAVEELNAVAYETGRKLFMLNAFEDAQLYLNVAAAAGYDWHLFALATCGVYRDGIGYSQDGKIFSHASDETKKWLTLAAAVDYVPALIQLGDAKSKTRAKELLDAGAVRGPLATYYMYLLTDDSNYLQQAATEGSSLAKFKLAQLYRRVPQMIENAALRTAKIEELFQDSADAGLPLAVYARVFDAESTASAAEKQTRLAQLAWLGQVEGMLEYGYALANMPRTQNPTPGRHQDGQQIPHTYGLARDLGVAHAMLKFVLKNTAGAIQIRNLATDIHLIEMRMSDADVGTSNGTLRQLAEKKVEPFYRLEELIIPGTAR